MRALTLISILSAVAHGAPIETNPLPTKDITFAEVDSHSLKLDLHLPEQIKNPPLVVFIHGGGWKSNSYKTCHTSWLTDYGFAVASISYRLTDKATFPAQVHDCKAAVRWLRKHAKGYGYNADRIGIVGTSAGGYLALFLGVTNDNKDFEGNVGDHLEVNTHVHAVVDYFGPSDFITRSKNQPDKTEKINSPVRLLLGHAVTENEDRARLASPITHVTKSVPPLLILHGDKDKVVNMRQSDLMHAAYLKAGATSTLQVVDGGNHGGKPFFTEARQKQVAEFLKKHLTPGP